MTDKTRIIKGLRLLIALCALAGAFLSSPVSALYECTRQEQWACMVDCVDQGADNGTCSGGSCYCY